MSVGRLLMRRGVVILIAAVLALVSLLAVGAPARAASTFSVTNPADTSDPGTLREAVTLALSGDTISIQVDLALGSTVVFPTGVTIEGDDASRTITRAINASFPLFTLDSVGQSYVVSSLTMTGGTGTGSAIYSPPGASLVNLTLQTVTISSHTSTQGSAVLVSAMGGELTVLDSSFVGNTATTGQGGAIWADLNQGGAEIRRTEFDQNTAHEAGGAVYTESIGSQPVILDELTVTDNTSEVDAGGGLFISGAFSFTLSNSHIEGNEAQNAGGGLYVGSAASLDVNTTTFLDNHSTANGGGGLYITQSQFGVVMADLTFTDNTANGDGGGLAVLNAEDLTIDDSTFTANGSDSQGGALYLDGTGNTYTTANTFTLNTAAEGGGAYIATQAGVAYFEDSLFDRNSSSLGGGLVVDEMSSEVQLVRDTFIGNVASSGPGGTRGGAVAIEEATSNGFLDVGASTFTDNYVDAGLFGTEGGASIAIETMRSGSGARISQSTFDEQGIQGTGSALWVDVAEANSNFWMYSLTIVAPVAFTLRDNSGVVEIFDSILAGDVDGIGSPAVILNGDPILLEYSILSSTFEATEVTDNGGNQFGVADAKLGPLQNNGGPTLTRLPLADSPAIDRATPGIAYPSNDQRGAGFPRILGGRVDVGAVEAPHLLAATGQSVNLWVPIGGGILLLLGAGALVFAKLRGRGAHRSASRTESAPEPD